MDWTQIEKDFTDLWLLTSPLPSEVVSWFKQRIESELPPPKLNEEEKNEFYRTDITAEVKPKYNV